MYTPVHGPKITEFNKALATVTVSCNIVQPFHARCLHIIIVVDEFRVDRSTDFHPIINEMIEYHTAHCYDIRLSDEIAVHTI